MGMKMTNLLSYSSAYYEAIPRLSNILNWGCYCIGRANVGTFVPTIGSTKLIYVFDIQLLIIYLKKCRM